MWLRIVLSNHRSEKDVKQASDFVTCVRLIALSKNQDDCTPLKIKEIIKNDYFKLNIMNRYADVDQCLPGKLLKF